MSLPRLGAGARTAGSAVFLVALGALAALTIRHFWPSNGSTDIFSAPASKRPPGEYLYLDSTRVAAYLSQLENGLLELPAFARVYPRLRPRTPALPLPLKVEEENGRQFDLFFPIEYAAL